MEVGTIIKWREGVMTGQDHNLKLAGERVLTGTITRVRVSRGGTTDYAIEVTSVEGYQAATVKPRIWVKRQKLIKGRSWQRELDGKSCRQ